MSELITLNVGDVLYAYGWGGGINSRHVISRVTAKRAFVRLNDNYEMCFDREQEPKWSITQRGASGFGATRYQLATPELDAKWRKAVLVEKCKSIKFDELPVEKLEQIIEIVGIGIGGEGE